MLKTQCGYCRHSRQQGWCTVDLFQGRKERSDGWAVGYQEAPGRGISVDVDLARQVANGDQNTSDQLQVGENLLGGETDAGGALLGV